MASHSVPVVRPAAAADAPLLSRLGSETFLETYSGQMRDEDVAEYVGATYNSERQARELADPTFGYLVLDGGGEAAGFALVCAGHDCPAVPGADVVELVRFYIRGPWQGRGLGRTLMDSVLAEARRLGGRRIWLSVWERNARAIAFYECMGFRVAGTQYFQLGADRQNDYVMVLHLPEQS